MGLLSTLLHEASARRPAEVLIETDRPVRMRLSDGSSAELAAATSGTAISDELSDLLTTEQQVDLALGEPVKFDLVVGLYTWHLVGETAQEVVSVRACPTSELLESSDSVQIPIEPDDEDDEDGEDVDMSDTQDIPRIRRALSSSGPSEIDIDVDLDDDAASSPTTSTPGDPSKGLRLAALKPVPADSKPQPMWPRRVARAVGPERGQRGVGAPRANTAAPRSADVPGWPRDARRVRPGPQPVGQPVASISALKPVPAATRQLPLRPAPRREATRAHEDRDMAEVLGAFEAGSLALLLGAAGHAESLAAALAQPSLMLGDDDTPAQASARLAELGGDGVLIVRAEDPSPWLGWLLRRVEEGRRVIVETDARTPAGARRILLGVGATPRAELWLDAVRVLSVTITDQRWVLLSPGD